MITVMSQQLSRLVLPDRPKHLAGEPVAAWREPVMIDTYWPGPPDPYPEYLDQRVYQGSSGAVYPMPFFERIGHTKAPHEWNAVHLENDYLRLMVIPDLGGRIHVAADRSNGYDFFYRNNVIKPALVGLAGPWISGGVEFNWPQHHRPGTFLPTDWRIEYDADGSVTVWCSDHDPFTRMKGMHGIRLRPQMSLIEVAVRVFNRSESVRTFLWWANVAAPVNDAYQSFFPTDVQVVADHAKRATATFPRVRGRYYGVDYPARVDAAHPDADRIDWYRNIPVPTSYMCLGSEDDFFGGYDHERRAGFVAWADHRIAPGKKQWTWGNAPFGWSWDRQLTDDDGPYVELMAGAFTDNQPDFSFLAPGETKTFSQFWYPIREIGVVHQATTEAAVHVEVDTAEASTRIAWGVAVTRPRPGLNLAVVADSSVPLWRGRRDATPDRPAVVQIDLDAPYRPEDLEFLVSHHGRQLVRWRPRPEAAPADPPPPATPIPAPPDIPTGDELVLSALHLEQYRHATRSPEPYLTEALRRDPADSRAAIMMSRRRYLAGQYGEAADYARDAIGRLTQRNPNPYDGEAHYLLGLAMMRLSRPTEALDALVKASWNRSWRPAALLAAARVQMRWSGPAGAADSARRALTDDADHLQVRDTLAVALAHLGQAEEADELIGQTLDIDPLDWWARDLAGEELVTDAQTCLDVVGEYRSLGAWDEALRVVAQGIRRAVDAPCPGLNNALPLLHYYRADLLHRMGREAEAAEAAATARAVDGANCLLGRLDDYDVIVDALARDPEDARAHYLVGSWLYSVRRCAEAQDHWREAVRLDPTDAISWRNLAVAAYNVDGDAPGAGEYYAKARAARPEDAKLLYEQDQLSARLGVAPEDRLAHLAAHRDLVAERDDLTAQYAELATLSGRPAEALAALGPDREFGPWEGGEGVVLGAWEHAHYALARQALVSDADPHLAAEQLRAALNPPERLGEARHLLANASDLWLALGDALDAVADGSGREEAQMWWRAAAHFEGDFQGMATQPYSEMTYYSILARRRLGDAAGAEDLTRGLAAYLRDQAEAPADIDYFATSLPTMLLFRDDIAQIQGERRRLIAAQLADLRGEGDEADRLTAEILRANPAHMRVRLWRAVR